MGLTQKELADRCGCSKSYVGHLERTIPSVIRMDPGIRQSLEQLFERDLRDLLQPLEA
jgi:transcriptional regulator with XRE-family HTH domain